MKYPKNGKFGEFGGKYIPETLVPAIEELEENYLKIKNDKKFKQELDYYLREYAGRPTPLYYAKNLSEQIGGAKIYLKREDLLHGGAHKINNTLGQALLAKKMKKKRIIAETGAGQHGVATAMACAALGMKAEVYMGYKDTIRQKLNVFRMNLLGSKVHPVKSGSQTLKDAINEAIRDWITNVESTYYLLGSAVGPHPYPVMVRDFQSIIGEEIKSQMKSITKKSPDTVIACVGGGSNAIGTFYPLTNTDAQIIGVEAAGQGLKSDYHSATLSAGNKGVLHGMMTYLLQDDEGQIKETHSISAGLDYPGVGPEHSYFKDINRVKYHSATDKEVIDAFLKLTQTEGIIPALESSHAIAEAIKVAKKGKKSESVVVTLSGRGDKDVEVVQEYLNKKCQELVKKFEELSAKKEKALISYIMAGYPNEKATISAVNGLIKGGVDIIELGFPFSDPLADGPVIQNASTISLEKGTKIKKFFEIVKKIRKQTDVPLVLMTYTNILYHKGYSKFIKEATKAGIDGFILPDMSVEEASQYLKSAKNQADTIFLISPNTSKTRIQKIAKASSGFLYLVAVYGTTGVKTGIKNYTIKAIKDVKKITKGKIPVGVGFGVSTPQDVRKYVSVGADAVIVGSAFLKLIEKTPQTKIESKITSFTKSLKKETRR